MTLTAGADDIRRVEPAAEADLDHRDIDLFLREAAKRERRAQFELGDLHAVLFAGLHRGPYAFHQRGQLVARNRFAVDADALVVDLDIRRGVQPGLVSRRAEHALDHRAAGALAVRSGDMHHGQLFLRIAEPSPSGRAYFQGRFCSRSGTRCESFQSLPVPSWGIPPLKGNVGAPPHNPAKSRGCWISRLGLIA